VRGSHDASDQLGQYVAALDMRQLVTKNELASGFRPFICLTRQEDDWPQDSPRQRHVDIITHQQRDTMVATGD
jgi:hypothetical protein